MSKVIETCLAKELQKLGTSDDKLNLYDQIGDLILDGRGLEHVTAAEAQMLTKLNNLSHLSLNQVHIKTLEWLPTLPQLLVLEATDNALGDDAIEIVVNRCPNLQRLELGGNRIRNFQSFQTLIRLPSLKLLGIQLNPAVEQMPEYRKILFEGISTLDCIDEQDRQGNEVEECSPSGTDDDMTLKEFYEKDFDKDGEREPSDFDCPGEELSEDIDDDSDSEMGVDADVPVGAVAPMTTSPN